MSFDLIPEEDEPTPLLTDNRFVWIEVAGVRVRLKVLQLDHSRTSIHTCKVALDI